jgi:hypothetical protein
MKLQNSFAASAGGLEWVSPLMAPADDELLKTRFELNMSRIKTVVDAAMAGSETTRLFEYAGAQGELRRAIVVFLHATFEVALRGHVSNAVKGFTFSGKSDLDKALKRSGVDPAQFAHLYQPLIQMARRRNRIVHQADLEDDSTIADAWNVADEWQLMLWLMAVPAFFYKMRIERGIASAKEAEKYNWNLLAMEHHGTFAKQVLAFPSLPEHLRIQGLQEISATLQTTAASLKGK